MPEPFAKEICLQTFLELVKNADSQQNNITITWY